MLLSNNLLSIEVIIRTIDGSHLFKMTGPVSIARLSVKFLSSLDLFGGWWELLFLLRGSTLLLSFQNRFSIFHVPFMLPLFRNFWISVRHGENWFM